MTTTAITEARTKLREAETSRDHVLRRIEEGDTKVTAKMLADSEDAVRHAELKIESAAKFDERRAAKKHQDKIDGLAAKLKSALVNSSVVTDIPTAIEKLDAALEEVRTAADAYEQQVSGNIRRLNKMTEGRVLPDGIDDIGPSSIVIDGTEFPAGTQLSQRLIEELVDRHGKRHLTAAFKSAIEGTKAKVTKIQLAKIPRREGHTPKVERRSRADAAVQLVNNRSVLLDESGAPLLDEPMVTVYPSPSARGVQKRRVEVRQSAADWLVEHGYAARTHDHWPAPPEPEPV